MTAAEDVGVVEQGRPDPKRAHGAWIYLFASVGAGALVGADDRVEPLMLVGTGFVAAFLVAAGISAGARRHGSQILAGATLALLAPLGALWMGARPAFLLPAAIAVPTAVAAVVLENRRGFLSRAALISGIAALAMAAPVVAAAGGTTVGRGMLLFGCLWPFYCWRTLRVAAPLRAGGTWDREKLREQGLREAAVAAVWTLAVAVTWRVFSTLG